MKQPSEVLSELSYDAEDFGVVEGDKLDQFLIGGADQLLAGVPVTDVMPLTCPESGKRFRGADIGTFVRLAHECADRTSTVDTEGARLLEVRRLERVHVIVGRTDEDSGAVSREGGRGEHRVTRGVLPQE